VGVWAAFWVAKDKWLSEADPGGTQADSAVAQRLGTLVKQVLAGARLSSAAGVGALADVGGPGGTGQGPVRLGRVPAVLLWSGGDLSVVAATNVSIDDISEPTPVGGGHLSLLCSVHAEEALKADPGVLGTAIFRLLTEPAPGHAEVQGLWVSAGPLVDPGVERWVVWYDQELRDPETLSPAERITFEGRPPPGDSGGPERLSLAGFLLRGDRMPEMFVPVEPGLVNAFFGRNGAGKSVTLAAVEESLRALRAGQVIDREHKDALPLCAVLLQGADHVPAPKLFGHVLAHLGWSPSTTLPDAVRRACQQALPAWNSAEERPADAQGMTVAELADLPYEQLRRVIADAVSSWLPGGHSGDCAPLAEAMAGSMAIVVTPYGRVGLAVIPGDTADDELRAAARSYLAAPLPVEDKAADNPERRSVEGLERAIRGLVNIGDHGYFARSLELALLRWAAHLAGVLPSGPIIFATAQLMHTMPRGPMLVRNAPYLLGSGWPQLGRTLAREVSKSVPHPVVFAPASLSPEPGDVTAERAILKLGEPLMGTSWGTDDFPEPLHPFGFLPEHAEHLAALLADEANRIVPRFVAEAGRLNIRIAPSEQWYARRAIATFSNGPGGEDGVPIDVLPSGIRTWVRAAISFALARLASASWTDTHEPHEPEDYGDADDISAGPPRSFRWNPSMPHGIYDNGERMDWFSDSAADSLTPEFPAVSDAFYLLDEPETHLHLTAQRDIVATAVTLAGESQGVITATHSLSFLDSPPGRTRVLTLEATPDGIRSSSDTGLCNLTAHAEALGLTPSALALACRGVLAVEGPSDVEVIQRYGGINLDRERIIIVPLHGMHEAASIAELEFLHALQIPVHVLFDHIRADTIREIIAGQPVSQRNKEEAEVGRLHQALRKRSLRVNLLPFSRVDIIRAVPEPEIAWALQELGKPAFIGWHALDTYAEAEWREHSRKYKDAFRVVTGATVDSVMRCLIDANRHGPRSPELHGILTRMLDYDPSGPATGIIL
jgi:hypothetical protein